MDRKAMAINKNAMMHGVREEAATRAKGEGKFITEEVDGYKFVYNVPRFPARVKRYFRLRLI